MNENLKRLYEYCKSHGYDESEKTFEQDLKDLAVEELEGQELSKVSGGRKATTALTAGVISALSMAAPLASAHQICYFDSNTPNHYYVVKQKCKDGSKYKLRDILLATGIAAVGATAMTGGAYLAYDMIDSEYKSTQADIMKKLREDIEKMDRSTASKLAIFDQNHSYNSIKNKKKEVVPEYHAPKPIDPSVIREKVDKFSQGIDKLQSYYYSLNKVDRKELMDFIHTNAKELNISKDKKYVELKNDSTIIYVLDTFLRHKYIPQEKGKFKMPDVGGSIPKNSTYVTVEDAVDTGRYYNVVFDIPQKGGKMVKFEPILMSMRAEHSKESSYDVKIYELPEVKGKLKEFCDTVRNDYYKSYYPEDFKPVMAGKIPASHIDSSVAGVYVGDLLETAFGTHCCGFYHILNNEEKKEMFALCENKDSISATDILRAMSTYLKNKSADRLSSELEVEDLRGIYNKIKEGVQDHGVQYVDIFNNIRSVNCEGVDCWPSEEKMPLLKDIKVARRPDYYHKMYDFNILLDSLRYGNPEKYDSVVDKFNKSFEDRRDFENMKEDFQKFKDGTL